MTIPTRPAAWRWLPVLLVGAAACATWSGLGDDLDRRWQGSWVVVGVETYSGCGTSYTANRVTGARVSSRGDHRFEPGEVARVGRVTVGRDRVDLRLDLAEPLLVARREGPFTLHEQTRCRVNLQVEVPRQAVRDRDVEAAEAHLAEVLERHDSRTEARASESWNRRQVEPPPEGYEETLADFEEWQVDQHNVEVDRRLAEATDEAYRAALRLRDDPETLEGFARGVEEMRRVVFGDCNWMLRHGFGTRQVAPPRDKRGNTREERRWREGFEQGQRLAFHLELLQRLPRCYRH